METAANSQQMQERIERLIKDFLGEKTEFNLDRYIQSQGLPNLPTLTHSERKLFAEELVEKIIRPATSSGKTSMARVELMSILQISVEPWKITANYVPSPREYLLETEMKDEFRKLRHQSIYREIVKYDLKDKANASMETRHQILNSVVNDIFGSIPQTTLAYAKELFNQYPVEWVINKNLTTYMRPKEAKESARNLIQLVDTLVIKDDEAATTQINEPQLSTNIMNHFTDTNQLLLRKFKNEYNIYNTQSMNDHQKQKMLYGIMSHFFGSMSQRFLNIECDKLKLEETADSADADRLKLINAIIHDCLHSSMNPEDAKRAHKEINELIPT